MANLQQRLAAAASASTTADAEEARARSEIEAMRASILAGETTGDRIRDYLIVKFGVIDESARERYEAINALMKGKTGELIVVHYTESVCTIHRFIGPNEYENVRYVDIAILAGDELVFEFGEKDATCSLPIKSYSQQEYRWTITEGTISEAHAGKIFLAKDCGKPVQSPSLLRGDWRPFNLEIGEEAAMAWIESNLMDFRVKKNLFLLILEKLGRLTLTSPEEDEDEE